MSTIATSSSFVEPATSSYTVLNYVPVLLLFIVCDTSKNGGAVGELLQVACPQLEFTKILLYGMITRLSKNTCYIEHMSLFLI